LVEGGKVGIQGGSKIIANKEKIGSNFEVGDDVIIECDELMVGDNVNVGVRTAESFRNVAGVRIKVHKLFLEDNVNIDRGVFIKGGEIHLGENVKIKPGSTINVKGRLIIGGYSTVNEFCEISGRDIEIGQELWMLPYAKIGGGSAFAVHSKLRIGHYCHIGMDAFINTARPVDIGDEVGLGTRTSFYTHGAYPSALKGFPVAFEGISIGDFTWIPGAIVNPGVKIGKNCVIGVNSLVTRDIPDGVFAAGSPAKILKENAFPRELTSKEKLNFFREFLKTFAEICSDTSETGYWESDGAIRVKIDSAEICFKEVLERDIFTSRTDRLILLSYDEEDFALEDLVKAGELITVFDLKEKYIYGIADKLSERLKDQLRRYGIRFYSRAVSRSYVKWR